MACNVLLALVYRFNRERVNGKESYLTPTLRLENHANTSTECFSLHQGKTSKLWQGFWISKLVSGNFPFHYAGVNWEATTYRKIIQHGVCVQIHSKRDGWRITSQVCSTCEKQAYWFHSFRLSIQATVYTKMAIMHSTFLLLPLRGLSQWWLTRACRR